MIKRLIRKIKSNNIWKFAYKKRYYGEWSISDKGKLVTNKGYFGIDRLYDWYDGTNTLIQSLDQKLVYMFHMLKAFGHHESLYCNASDFLTLATDNDKNLILNKINDQFLSLTKNKFLQNATCIDSNSKDFWIMDINVDTKISESGYISIYLVITKDSMELDAITFKDKRIPDKPLFYSLSFENGEYIRNPCPKYTTKRKTIVKESLSDKPIYWTIDLISNGIQVNDLLIKNEQILSDLIKYQHSITLNNWELKTKWESDLTSILRGRYIDLIELVSLHKKLKKLINFDIDNIDKYNDWVQIKDKEKQKVRYEELNKLYQNDISKVYHEIADYFANHHSYWWD